MGFYVDPAFFVLAAIAVVPAIVLGINERSLFGYSLVVSGLFLLLLFFYDLQQGAAFVFFCVLSTALFLWVKHLFATKHPHAVALYRLALAITMAPLVIYKIAAVFDGNLLGFLGISYITFKALQVLIEVRDGLITDMSVLEYLGFLVFFTPFTSGPIMRSRTFVEDARTHLSRHDYLDGLTRGAFLFLLGAFYKFVLAALSSWAQWFTPEFIGAGTFLASFAGESCIAFFYGLYLFFDFAGYSLMAIGLGSVFGVRVPRNFNAPFISLDIKDFWNRWHMSLSFWLRDFVFMRLTRALLKRKVFASRVNTACAGYLANMTIMGFWHGITPDYIIYGIYHGLLLSACELFQKKSKLYAAHKDEPWFKLCSWAITMIAVFFGFSLFSGQVSRLILGA
ncbi:MAG: D-alanyl-lipoteichoic acid biosynthesis protein DltB [Eggerthellaceae bacterium]|nr:D-alanyl-lipoteichoic acid biosynthesis protein DltB [Eggerthellaceae bacterium]